ncbi:aldehyde dehydrogenase [Bradyrhizobium macuxiense]|uniref:Aldehyde dehydrogenase n=1 Tax=Bradyrhizobium macuxiense TaxID=1755647 RepID=A0A109JGU1_9BRAD|nr:aldehyde dehydrogenase family protein [Bradyrhizobium macuxiense]KWV48464.1 aldehyde dehydrogenase [Bradyrhizobium macuxiense]
MFDQATVEEFRSAAVQRGRLLIDGSWVEAADGATMDVVSPLDGRVLTTIAKGTRKDADAAIKAARVAFTDGRWSSLPPAARKLVLLKWAELIERNAMEIAVLGVRDNGTEIAMAYKAEPLSAAATIRYYAEALDKIYGEIAPTGPETLALVHREPVGVVGAILPWNFPLMIGAWKIGPALAVGCTMVVKPSESASLTLLKIADLGLQAGLPAGVLNIVTGEGTVVGAAISESMDIDVLTFTGSGPTGRRLMEAAARSNLKRVYLELGGKSPNVVFADAPNLAEAAKVAAGGIFRNSGQVCIAGSRLLVERSVHDAFVVELTKAMRGIAVGDPLDIRTGAGAVTSAAQLDRNLGFVKEAHSLGRTVVGGARIREETGGFFMEPTIITGVEATDRLAREEVFGPVLAVTPFDTEEEALALANGTEFGLAAAVWTSNLSRAHRMVRGINAGVVHVNTYGGADLTVPLGGLKQSGNGHDKSLHAFDKFLDLKTAWIKL